MVDTVWYYKELYEKKPKVQKFVRCYTLIVLSKKSKLDLKHGSGPE